MDFQEVGFLCYFGWEEQGRRIEKQEAEFCAFCCFPDNFVLAADKF
jgi:hypothetical protein